MKYMEIINDFSNLTRAVRTGDYKFYIQVLPEFMKLFHVFLHHNYARYLRRYRIRIILLSVLELLICTFLFYFSFYDNLLSMEDSHSGITELFESGGISIRRTNKPFSPVPIDLTLEQTINKDAVSASGKSKSINHRVLKKMFYYTYHFMYR